MSVQRAKKEGSETRLKVFVRIRPPNSKDFRSRDVFEAIEVEPDNKTLVLYPTAAAREDRRGEMRRFDFHHILQPSVTQEEVYAHVGSEAVNRAFQGINSSIFAYGHTGTGKTYSIVNIQPPPQVTYPNTAAVASCEADEGLIPRTMRHIFAMAAQARAENPNMEVDISFQYIQLYRVAVQDLLSANLSDVRLQDEDTLKRATDIKVPDFDTFLATFAIGDTRKVVAETQMNGASSRGHTILLVKVRQFDPTTTAGAKMGKIVIADLAGFERIKDTKVEGIRRDEANAINTGLLALAHVIQALRRGDKHVPWRNSQLTRALQDCLGGNSATTCICTISAHSGSLMDTQNTLHFGYEAMQCKTSVTVNVGPTNWRAEAERLQAVVRQLEQRLAAGDSDVGVPRDTEAVRQLEVDRDSLRDRLVNLEHLQPAYEQLLEEVDAFAALNNMLESENAGLIKDKAALEGDRARLASELEEATAAAELHMAQVDKLQDELDALRAGGPRVSGNTGARGVARVGLEVGGFDDGAPPPPPEGDEPAEWAPPQLAGGLALADVGGELQLRRGPVEGADMSPPPAVGGGANVAADDDDDPFGDVDPSSPPARERDAGYNFADDPFADVESDDGRATLKRGASGGDGDPFADLVAMDDDDDDPFAAAAGDEDEYEAAAASASARGAAAAAAAMPSASALGGHVGLIMWPVRDAEGAPTGWVRMAADAIGVVPMDVDVDSAATPVPIPSRGRPEEYAGFRAVGRKAVPAPVRPTVPSSAFPAVEATHEQLSPMAASVALSALAAPTVTHPTVITLRGRLMEGYAVSASCRVEAPASASRMRWYRLTTTPPLSAPDGPPIAPVPDPDGQGAWYAELIADGHTVVLGAQDVGARLLFELVPILDPSPSCREPVVCRAVLARTIAVVQPGEPQVRNVRIEGRSVIGKRVNASYFYRGGVEGATRYSWQKTLDGTHWSPVDMTVGPPAPEGEAKDFSLYVSADLLHHYLRLRVHAVRWDGSRAQEAESKLVYVGVDEAVDEDIKRILAHGSVVFNVLTRAKDRPCRLLLTSSKVRILASDSTAAAPLFTKKIWKGDSADRGMWFESEPGSETGLLLRLRRGDERRHVSLVAESCRVRDLIIMAYRAFFALSRETIARAVLGDLATAWMNANVWARSSANRVTLAALFSDNTRAPQRVRVPSRPGAMPTLLNAIEELLFWEEFRRWREIGASYNLRLPFRTVQSNVKPQPIPPPTAAKVPVPTSRSWR